LPRRVRRRSTQHRFEDLRRHAFSRAFALFFIALILIPFTVPFPTYQLHQSSSDHPLNALPKPVKDKTASGDEAISLPSYALAPPVDPA